MLKIPYHAFLGLIIAFGGTSRLGLHACMLEILQRSLGGQDSDFSNLAGVKHVYMCHITVQS